MTAMGNTEKTELTVMCMICDGTKILVQDRVNKDWPGVTFPGGHCLLRSARSEVPEMLPPTVPSKSSRSKATP